MVLTMVGISSQDSSDIQTNTTMIHVIGLGVTETKQLSADARAALLGAELVIGSGRQLEIIKPVLGNLELTGSQASQAFDQRLEVLPKLNALKSLIDESGAKQVVMLASGDPLYYGIGRWLSKQFTAEQLRFYPAVSSIQAACHSIGLSLQDARVISLHGRPVLTLRRHLAQQQYLVILTDQHSTPQALAALCNEAGFGESQLWVCERLGYQDQQVRAFTASELIIGSAELSASNNSPTAPKPSHLPLQDHDNQSSAQTPNDLNFDPLHVTIIKVIGQPRYLPSFPGIPDHHFITDSAAGRGLITKREVRLTILSLLQPAPSDIGWDIGAGCGGVAVEWALWNPLGEVHAIEHHAVRFDCLQQNQQRFGVVDNLKTVNGRAPEVLASLPAANKIFIGGSDGELPNLLESLWKDLPLHGVIVASAVMETSRMQLIQFADRLKDQLANQSEKAEVETLQMSVSKGGELAGQLLYRPSLPVTLFKFTKVENTQ